MQYILRCKGLIFLWQITVAILCFPLYVLSILIPIKNNLWIFGNVFGYKDNARYLYEYTRKNHPEIQTYWIYKEKQQFNYKDDQLYFLSVRGLWVQFRAAIAILSTGSGDVARFTLLKKIKVQLWHGIPIKKILLDSKETLPFPHMIFFSGLYLKLFRRNLKKYDLIIAANESNKACLTSAFGVSSDKVVVTGTPRHDIILSTSKNIPKSKNGLKILYAPTWRRNSDIARKNLEWLYCKEFNSWCHEKGVVVDICIHPLNDYLSSEVKTNSVIKLYSGDDINCNLTDYALLITDYSSIAIDYSILHRPVLYYCIDYEEYDKARGLYDYYNEIINEKKNSDVTSLINEIKSKFDGHSFISNDVDVQSFIVDGGACPRIIKEVKRYEKTIVCD